MPARYGSFINFAPDLVAFGISKMEGVAMNRGMLLTLETSASTICASNCRESLANAPIGFFLGASGVFSSSGTSHSKASSVYSGTSEALSVASGRVSYTLGLTGPCLTLDTACSSSLVSLHLGASAVDLFECPQAAAAGIGILTKRISIYFSVAGMLSARGRCHTFDRHADGYCRGEGSCASLLVSGCVNHTCILDSAVQQDGPSASLTAPNGSSQRRLIEAVGDRS